MAKQAMDAQQKAISDTCNEIKLLSLEALKVKRDGGNYFNTLCDVMDKTNDLYNMVQSFK